MVIQIKGDDILGDLSDWGLGSGEFRPTFFSGKEQVGNAHLNEARFKTDFN